MHAFQCLHSVHAEPLQYWYFSQYSGLSFYPNRYKLYNIIYGQAFYSNSDTALLILPGPH